MLAVLCAHAVLCARAALAPRITCSGDAYLHVGPYKAASSTIQERLVAPASRLIRILNRDGYIVPRAVPGVIFHGTAHEHQQLGLAIARSPLVPANATIPHFTQQVSRAAWAHQCVFFSSEALSLLADPRRASNAGALDAVLQPFGRVHIIVVYRRLYEWLVSWHNEMHRMNWRRAHRSLAAEAPLYVRLVDWLRSDTAEMTINSSWTAPVAEWYASRFGGDAVRVLNMHDVGSADITEQLVCAYMQASQACAHARAHRQSARHANPSQDLRALDVLMFVVGRGDLEGLNITAVPAGAVAARLGSVGPANLARLPSECLSSKEVQRLRHRSMRAEAALLPDWHNASEFARSFDEPSRRQRFCSVDTIALLAGTAADNAAAAAKSSSSIFNDKKSSANRVSTSGGSSGGKRTTTYTFWYNAVRQAVQSTASSCSTCARDPEIRCSVKTRAACLVRDESR